MAVAFFGVTVEAVRGHHFPNFDAWTTSSRPSSTIVTEAINAEAARLQGRLLKESITAATIDAAPTSAAYLMCADVLRLMVAVRLARDMPGVDSPLAKVWADQVKDWFDLIEKDGATFLGDNGLNANTDPDGPTDFIGEYALSTGDDADASTAKPYLRRDDVL